MENQRLIVNSYYTLRDLSDRVVVIQFDNKNVWYRYFNLPASRRNLPIEVFNRIYDYDKTFNLLWRNSEKKN